MKRNSVAMRVDRRRWWRFRTAAELFNDELLRTGHNREAKLLLKVLQAIMARDLEETDE
jgi:hypothetical protein